MLQRTTNLVRDRRIIVLWLWCMPFLSISEMAAFTGIAKNRCYRLLRRLQVDDLVCSVRLGMLYPAQDRWFLTSHGVAWTREETNYRLPLPINWANCESGLRRLVLRFPQVETAYRVLPGLWSHDGMQGPRTLDLGNGPDPEEIQFPADLEPKMFQWLRNRDLHARIDFKNESWALMVGTGPTARLSELQEQRARALGALVSPTPGTEPRQPAAWVLAGGDRLAAIHAAELWTEPNVLSVTGGGRTVKPMAPAPFTRPFWEDFQPTTVGRPERIPGWVEAHPVISALNGKQSYRLYRFVMEWPGSSRDQIQRKITESNDVVDGMIARMTTSNVIAHLDGGYYPGEAGILAASRLDRVSLKSVKAQLGGFLSPSANRRGRMRRHDRSVIDVALALEKPEDLGIEVFNGWRGVRDLDGKTQIAPDAVVTLKRFRTHQVLYLELELSATALSQARRKVGPYRLARQLGYGTFPLIMVCPNRTAEEHYWKEGRGLLIVTSTVEEMLRGPFTGPDSVLRLFGEPTSIEDL